MSQLQSRETWVNENGYQVTVLWLPVGEFHICSSVYPVPSGACLIFHKDTGRVDYEPQGQNFLKNYNYTLQPEEALPPPSEVPNY